MKEAVPAAKESIVNGTFLRGECLLDPACGSAPSRAVWHFDCRRPRRWAISARRGACHEGCVCFLAETGRTGIGAEVEGRGTLRGRDGRAFQRTHFLRHHFKFRRWSVDSPPREGGDRAGGREAAAGGGGVCRVGRSGSGAWGCAACLPAGTGPQGARCALRERPRGGQAAWAAGRRECLPEDRVVNATLNRIEISAPFRSAGMVLLGLADLGVEATAGASVLEVNRKMRELWGFGGIGRDLQGRVLEHGGRLDRGVAGRWALPPWRPAVASPQGFLSVDAHAIWT